MRKVLDMISRSKSALTNLSVYFVAALIPMLLSLLSNPFLAKNMSPVDYSIVGYYTAFSALFTPFVNFYLLNFYTKKYFELDADNRLALKSTLFKTLTTFSFVMSAFSLLLLYIYTEYFNQESKMPFLPYAILANVCIPLTGIYTLSLADYRMSRNSKKFFSLSVGNGVIGTVLALLLVVVFKFGALGRLTAAALSAFMVFAYVFYRNRELWRMPFHWQTLRKSLVFCSPLVVAAMLNFFANGYDKVVLERAGDLHALGVYNVGFSIAMYMNVFSNSINDTFQPDVFESVVKKQYARCVRFILLKLGLMSVMVILFVLFAPLAIRILTYGRYMESVPFAIIISVSSLTSMMYYSMSQVTVAIGYTFVTLANKVLGSILSIVSFYILVRHFGAVGAAWGVVLSYLYFFIGNVLMVVGVYAIRRMKNENRGTYTS